MDILFSGYTVEFRRKSCAEMDSGAWANKFSAILVIFFSPSCLSEEQPELMSCSLTEFSQPATCPSAYCFKAWMEVLIPAVGSGLSNKLFCSLILCHSSLPADLCLSDVPIQKLGILIFLHSSEWSKSASQPSLCDQLGSYRQKLLFIPQFLHFCW